MTFLDRLSLFTPLDAIAIGFLALAWFGLSLWIERDGLKRPSVTILMVAYRREWFRQCVTRDTRIFDAQILTGLRQGTAFFASGCMIAIGGLLALAGNTEPLQNAARDLANEDMPDVIWQIKLIVVIVLLTHGFLKFVWANRLFGYCAVVMAATPNDKTDPDAFPRAAKAAEINIRAAWNFNRGLRAIYFSLGTLAWLLGPIFLIVAIFAVGFIIWQREFSSIARGILVNDPDAYTSDVEVEAHEVVK